jgi:hypothetical protein
MRVLPFRPVDDTFDGFAMPATVPPGMRLQLSRAPVVPGREEELSEWMSMLTDRYGECLETLPAERAVFEALFRHREADGSLWIYHLSLSGENGAGLDVSHPVDAAHADYSHRVKEPGWEEIQPLFLLTPSHLRTAMEKWAASGVAD